MGVTREVRIEIGEIDLIGVPAARRFEIAASFERELTRLIERDGLPEGLANADERPAFAVPDAAHGSPLMFGHALARAVYGALA
jgi:hypothetical protein